MAVLGAQVFACEQYLRNGHLMWVEILLPSVDQDALADRGACLEEGQVLRALVEPELPHAKTDRSRTDDDHLNAAFAEGHDLSAEGINARRIQVSNAGCKHTRAELDDNTLRLCEWNQSN